MQQLGIADEVADRLKIFPNGATAMRELAASDAQRPIGCTQSTEIISTEGVVLSGSLPPGCELATMYTAGVTTKAAHASAGQGLIDLLTGAGQGEQRERAGFISGLKLHAESPVRGESWPPRAESRTRSAWPPESAINDRFRFVKVNSYTNISIERAAMPARATKRTEPRSRR